LERRPTKVDEGTPRIINLGSSRGGKFIPHIKENYREFRNFTEERSRKGGTRDEQDGGSKRSAVRKFVPKKKSDRRADIRRRDGQFVGST